MRVGSGLAVVCVSLLVLLAVPVRAPAFFANWPACLRLAVVGVCEFGIRIVYWAPTALIETTPQCGVTAVPVLAPQVAKACAVPCGVLGMFGSSMRPSSARLDTNYAETHVFEYPFDPTLVSDVADLLCFLPHTPLPRVVYLSEVDLVQWHTGFLDLADPRTWSAPGCAAARTVGTACMGAWGPIFPRTGWLNHPSKLAHSAGLAYRALHLARERGLYHGGMTPWDSLQMAFPTVSRCFQIGEPPVLWESGLDLPANQPQHFLWVYWRFVTCCI